MLSLQTMKKKLSSIGRSANDDLLFDEVTSLWPTSVQVADEAPCLNENALNLFPETAEGLWNPLRQRIKYWKPDLPSGDYESAAEPIEEPGSQTFDFNNLSESQPLSVDLAVEAPVNFPSWVASLESLQRWGLYKIYRDSSNVRPVFYGDTANLAEIESLWPLYPSIWATGAWWARHLCCEVTDFTFKKERSLGCPVTKTADRPTWHVNIRVDPDNDNTMIIEEFATAGAGAPGQQTMIFQIREVLRALASSEEIFQRQWDALQVLVSRAPLVKGGSVPRAGFTMIAAHLALLGTFPTFDPFGDEFNPQKDGEVLPEGRQLSPTAEASHTCDCAGCVKGIHVLSESHKSNLGRVNCQGTVLTVWEGVIVNVKPCPHAWRPRNSFNDKKARFVHHTSCARVVLSPYELPEGVSPPPEWITARDRRNQSVVPQIASDGQYWGRIFADRFWGTAHSGGFEIPSPPPPRGSPKIIEVAPGGRRRLSAVVALKRKEIESSTAKSTAEAKKRKRVPFAAAALAQAAQAQLMNGEIELETIRP